MKITILCVVVMLLLGVAHLQSIEFGKNSEEGFRFRHGPKVEHSVPLTSIEQVSAPVDDEIGVDFENEPAGQDSLSYNDNRGMHPLLLVLSLPRGQINTDYMLNMVPIFDIWER